MNRYNNKNPNDYTVIGKYSISNPCSHPNSTCSKFYKQYPELAQGDVVENYCGANGCPDRNHVLLNQYDYSDPCQRPGTTCGVYQRNLQNQGEKLWNK